MIPFLLIHSILIFIFTVYYYTGLTAYSREVLGPNSISVMGSSHSGIEVAYFYKLVPPISQRCIAFSD